MKSETYDGQVGARIPKDLEEAIREQAALEDRPVAYIVRRTLLKEFGQKNE